MKLLITLSGRRLALSVSIAAAGLLLLALFACAGRTFELAVLFAARAMAACAYQTVFVYTRDVYPSSVRSTAVRAVLVLMLVLGLGLGLGLSWA